MKELLALREKLAHDLAAVDATLRLIEQYDLDIPELEPAKTPPAERIGSPKKKPKPASKEWNSNGLAGGRRSGLREAILSAVGEKPLTNMEILEAVAKSIPNATGKSVNQTIWVLKSQNEINKGDDLLWRLAR